MKLSTWRFVLVFGVAVAACVALFEAFAPRIDSLDGTFEPVGSWFAIPGRPASAYEITGVDKGGNLARAGIAAGDRIVPDDSFYWRWLWKPGDALPVTIETAAGSRTATLVAARRVAASTFEAWVVRIGRLTLQLALLALAVTLAWQLPDELWMRWLCTFLTLFGLAPWQVDPAEYVGPLRLVAATLENGTIQAGICSALVFGATIRGVPTEGGRLWMLRLAPVAFGLLLVAVVALDVDLRPVYVTLPFRLLQVTVIVSIVASLAWAAAESSGQDRQRLRYMTWTFALGFSGFFASVAILGQLGNAWGMNYQVWSLPRMTLIAIPIGFGYGLLSHRVVSTSYIATRTLVYGALTSSLVPLFAIGEWAATSLFSSGSGKSAIFVGLTVVITASFKTVHAKLDAIFDKWIFKAQHADEKAIAQFVKEVPFLHDADALVGRCMTILDRHIGAKSSGFYLHAEPEILGDRNLSADYVRVGFVGDGVPERIPELDPLILALKSEGTMVETDELGKGGHAFPIIARGHLTAFFAFGPMRDGEILTPDETKRMTELTTAVASSLEAIRVTDLETRLASAQAGRAELHRLLTDLLHTSSGGSETAPGAPNQTPAAS